MLHAVLYVCIWPLLPHLAFYPAPTVARYWDDIDKGKDWDFVSTIGFLQAIKHTLRIMPSGVLHGGVPCSSFIFMSRGTSKRSRCWPAGNTKEPTVALANTITSRFSLLILIALARSVWWTVEQPLSSLMAAYAPMRHAMEVTASFLSLNYVSTSMGMFGAFSVKPSQIWGSLPEPEGLLCVS